MAPGVFEEMSSARQFDVVGDLLRKTGSCGIASAIFRDDGRSPSLRFIGAQGIPAESLNAYKDNNLFRQDPFLRFAANQKNATPRSCSILRQEDINWDELSGADYKYFQSFYGVNIVYAAILTLRENLFLSLCLHSLGQAEPVVDHRNGEVIPEINKMVTDVALTLLGRELSEGREPVPDPFCVDMQRDVKMSSREQEIVRLVCDGMMNKQIAYQMGISINAVENNLRRIFKKFDVRNRSSLINRYRAPRYH